MQKDEVIHIPPITDEVYHQMAVSALKYGLISISFTYNRMAKSDLKQRVINVIKGKIAESVFGHYNKKCGLNLDFQRCTTPFWLPDLRDFAYLGGEWDIKNNFVYCTSDQWSDLDLGKLPALIPDKSDFDQWSKRDLLLIEGSWFNAYVFTFMRLEKDRRDFFEIDITDDQWQMIHDLTLKYQNYRQSEMPFIEEIFYQKIEASQPLASAIKILYQPDMIITSCANARYWDLFRSEEGTSFCNGYLRTIIKNKMVEVRRLPAWQQVIKMNGK